MKQVQHTKPKSQAGGNAPISWCPWTYIVAIPQSNTSWPSERASIQASPKTDGIFSYRSLKSLSIFCVNCTLTPTYWRGNISMVPTTLMQCQWVHRAVSSLLIQRVPCAGFGIFGAGSDSTLDHCWYTTGATISSVETHKQW